MLYLRAFSLEVLICLHVIGGAFLFRRFFPRESQWWGFFLPMLGVVTVLNFIEHFVPFVRLSFLLPLTIIGSIWFILCQREQWRWLWLPGSLFVAIFTFALAINCYQPNVNFYCTEGLTDMNRILDFTLGDTLPPQDCWLPLYPHNGYYTFMHYGASIMMRLFGLDIGTAYNLSYDLVNSLILLTGAAVGYSLSNQRKWIAILTLLIVAGGFTGSTPLRLLLDPSDPNPASTIDVGGDWDNPEHNPFSALLKHFPPDYAFRIFSPGCYLYYCEFHATMAGHFLALLTVFAVSEVLRRRRAIFPWLWLLTAPVYAIISCTWFFFLIVILAGPTLVFAWVIGRRPSDIRAVLLGTLTVLALLSPTLYYFLHGAISQQIILFTYWHSDIGVILIQLWPIYLPWLALCLVWKRLSVAGRWLHLSLIPIFVFAECIFFTDRGTTLEKLMGGSYGIGLVALCPVLFVQRGWGFRALSGVMVTAAVLSLWTWTSTICVSNPNDSFLHLEGDYFLRWEPPKYEMEEILRRYHGQTILIGKNTEAWFESPCLPAFTNNRSFVGWTNAEESCGHAVPAHLRANLTNAFYAGTLADPLAFLQDNEIAAVLVWPNDKMSSEWLNKITRQLAPAYTYIDCKIKGGDNAGVFVQKN